MDINDILNLMTPEQLEELAELKRRKENGRNKQQQGKRKQQRRNKDKDEIIEETKVKPKRKYATKSETTLGKRQNKFLNSKEFNEHLEEIEELPMIHKQKRKQQLVSPKCSKCNTVYHKIPINLCYKDESEICFICDNCI